MIKQHKNIEDMQTNHRVIVGDSRRMAEIADDSVHLIVTSPPYWQLKDYGHSAQIGFNDTYEDYINHLNLVWAESFRVLSPGCRLCINIGDQFARSVYYGRYKVIPIRTEITKFCEIIGFDYMGAVIWQKVTTTNTTGGATIMGSFPYPRNGILKIDYEFILIFKKQGASLKVPVEVREASKLSTAEWNEYFAGHWNFPGERQNRHLAMFPKELPRRIIKMFSFVGDTVLDPFLGSGTTSLAAKELRRNSIGYEINEEFVPVIRHKLQMDQNSTFDTFSLERQKPLQNDFSTGIACLPYRFQDPVRFNKKLDPRKLGFGSKIGHNDDSSHNAFLTILNVLSPELVMLSSNQPVRLLGIRAKADTMSEAMKFLVEKTRGHQVFLRFDRSPFTPSGELSCYLYLRNKTFINAHLIKSGLVGVDIEADYKLKLKFLQIQEELRG